MIIRALKGFLTAILLSTIYFAIFTISLFNYSYAESRQSSLRSFGDYAQILNPIIASSIASKEKGFGHFAIIYGQSWIATHGIKLAANKFKWEISKRPFIQQKKDRYDGMPSGHTNSGWLAASYVRIFGGDYKNLSIPLYLSAALTGYSRIRAKEHTTQQVIVGAVLAEAVTYINSKLEWNNEYRSTSFYFGKNEMSLGFELRF